MGLKLKAVDLKQPRHDVSPSRAKGFGGIEHLLVKVEAAGGGRDVELFVLHSQDVQVHQVSVHLPVSWRGVPAAHAQHLQAP